MNRLSTTLIKISMGLAALVPALQPAFAQTQASSYPDKSIRWVVYFPPGGGADYMTRLITQRVQEQLKQPVVIDNRPGAGGTLGMEVTAKSPADGYTAMTGEIGGVTMNPSLYRKLRYDVVKDFQPIGLFAKQPFLFVVNTERVPVKTFKEFIAYAKARDGKVTYASFGTGSLTHVMTELLQKQVGIHMVHVPYKGAAPVTQALVAGEVDAAFTDTATAKSFMSTGKFTMFGLSSRERAPSLPDVPSLSEVGAKDYDISIWLGALAPAHTPRSAVDRLKEAMDQATHSDVVKKAFEERGILPVTSRNPEEFAQLIRDDIAKWADVIKGANISLD